MSEERTCGDCMACCQGWVPVKIGDYVVEQGSSCKHLMNGCSLQDNKPKLCSLFKCSWLEGELPEELKPNKAKAIVYKTKWRDQYFYKCTEMGETLSDDFLLAFTNLCKERNVPYIMQYAGMWHVHGDPAFVAFINSNSKHFFTS